MEASVVIATYNGSRFIREALESVFAQTRLPREIIVVDDLSTDNTVELVGAIAQDSPVPLEVICLETNSGGPARPMNVGIEAAAGEIICLLDHDDLMDSRKIETHTRALEDPTVGLAFGQAATLKDGVAQPPKRARFAETTSRSEPALYDNVRILDAEAALDLLLHSGYNYGGAGGSSFRKAAWQTVGRFDESYKIVWDYDFALRLTGGGFKVAYCDEVAFIHRVHEGNLEFTQGGIHLARETVRLFETHSNSTILATPAKSELAKLEASARLGLVWRLRQSRQFGEAFRELRWVVHEGGFSPRCAKEFVKTAIASVTPAFLAANRRTGS